MKNTRFTYHIGFFSYDKPSNTLQGYEKDLYYFDYVQCFPNGRSKFFITNPKTGGFRRFIFHKEFSDKYIFKSEDGILCRIIKK
jgi:hypothetical protein